MLLKIGGGCVRFRRMRLLALVLMLLSAAGVSAQPHSPSEQSDTREKDAPQQAATPTDSITIPDGTPLTLKLVSELSSATAKVGDAVHCVAFPLRINGLVVVPAGTAISGIVVYVDHPHRRMKNGLVRVAVNGVVLPGGESASLRTSKAPAGKSDKMKAQPGSPSIAWEVAAAGAFTFGFGAPLGAVVGLFEKGQEQVYPAGTVVTVYINGPLHLDRDTVLKLQPSPYKGPAQVFVNHTLREQGWGMFAHTLYCSDRRVGSVWPDPMRIDLNPGTYSFSLRKERDDLPIGGKQWSKWGNIARAERASKRAKTVQLEVQNDHQYWIEWDWRGLRVMDAQAYPTEFDIVRDEFKWTNVDLQNGCPLAEPAAPASARPSTTQK